MKDKKDLSVDRVRVLTFGLRCTVTVSHFALNKKQLTILAPVYDRKPFWQSAWTWCFCTLKRKLKPPMPTFPAMLLSHVKVLALVHMVMPLLSFKGVTWQCRSGDYIMDIKADKLFKCLPHHSQSRPPKQYPSAHVGGTTCRWAWKRRNNLWISPLWFQSSGPCMEKWFCWSQWGCQRLISVWISLASHRWDQEASFDGILQPVIQIA